MTKPYGLLDQAEFDALMKNARHTRGGTLIDHVARLFAALRKAVTTR